MRIVASYSFNGGQAVIESKYSRSFRELKSVVKSVEADVHKTKASKEKTMPGKVLYNPRSLNTAFKSAFEAVGWQKQKVHCDYPTQFYAKGYTPSHNAKNAFREMDFLKNKLGVEVQFGKYAFMVYNVCAKDDHLPKVRLHRYGNRNCSS